MQHSSATLPVILTGDRTTGPLHLGHYVGSLKNRATLQTTHQQYLLLADAQALTDNAHNPGRVRDNVLEIATDYLAVGIDPNLTTICLQSHLPALADLTLLYMNFVTVARLERNPTIKDEIQARGFGRDIPAGFLCYPVAQAADITGFKATIVPVGEDQAPLIEQTNEVVRRINRQAGVDVLPEARALIPRVGRLPGIDGKAKMSKSQGNAPNHIKASDPGRVEGNVVFTYLDAFDEDHIAVEDLKARYIRGGLGDSIVKKRLDDVLQALLAPIRDRRRALARDPGYVLQVVKHGTARAREITDATLRDVRAALGLFTLN